MFIQESALARRRFGAATAVLSVGLAFVIGWPVSADPGDSMLPGKPFGTVTAAAAQSNTANQARSEQGTERVSVLVHVQAGADRVPVRAFAAAQGAYVKYEYDILPNVINIRNIPKAALEGLLNTQGVVRWEEDKPVHAHLNDSTPLIRALQSQITGAGLSADGSGVRVCIIDTGIDSDHAMYSARIDTAAGRDFVNNDNNPEDDAGHGSHVAGIAVGGVGLTVDFGCVGPEPFQGVAPQATLIGIKVLNSSGSGSFSDVIAGINYGADQSPTGGRCDVINMSLGGGQFSGNCDGDSAAAAANNAVDAGVVVVASAGNNGFSNAMGTPACGSKVISVGLTYDDSYPSCEFPSQSSFTWCLDSFCFSTCTDNTPNVDEISCMSNRSSTLDVTAPGCITFSADYSASPNGIIGECGTSMSSPHVAGLAALLLSADSSLTPTEVRQYIRDGAIDLGPAGFDNTYGWGRIDAINSLNFVAPGCTNNGECDDGLFCNGAETCVSGSCQAGTPPNCNDGVGCTDDSCNEGTDSCDHVANNANCNDGLFCNGAETCNATLDCQAGTPPNCNDGVGCTDDSCNEGTDSCDHVANNANCDDGLFCNGAETCNATLDCQAGAAPNCNDGVGCTVDSCNEDTDSCDNIPNNTLCDDGLFCNGVETCNATLDCQGGSDPCPGQICDEGTDTCNDCVTNGDCDDGLFCNGAETCVGGTCQAGTAVNCGDGVGCTDDSCNEATDSCDHIANNANCDDGLFCNGSESCSATLDCQPGTAPNCNDGIACTDDSCNEATDSCDNIANDANCDNGLFCDGAETCSATLDCQAGTAPNCNDSVGCTDDSCNEATDSCDHIANNGNCPDDGLFCNGTEFCDAVLDCSSTGDPCTGGTTCNEATDTCDAPVCDNDGTCESGEDCNNCPNDCPSGSGASCGNGVCEAGDGEDCVSCPSDCNGLQSGKPQNRFCCGDGGGQNPLTCSNPICTAGGFSCTDVPAVPSCCGDLVCEGSETSFNCALDCGAPATCGDSTCDPGEDQCNCAADCGTPPSTESSCTDGVDNDCDTFTDCNDSDCVTDPGCACASKGAACSVDGDCCSLSCKNNGTCR